jgi:hypothetical protein
LSCESREEKTRGGNMKVSLAMLLKTNIEKMSENRSLAMFMKSNELKSLSGDVDENKGSYSRKRNEWQVTSDDLLRRFDVPASQSR